MIMNKRGDVAMILLFVVTLTLVVITLFFMASFNSAFARDSEGRDDMLSLIKFYENYAVNDAGHIVREGIISGEPIVTDAELKERFGEIAKKNNFVISGLENYFGKIKRGEFELKHDGNEYLFEMKNLSFVADSGANSFTRELDFRIRFDFNGNALKVERFINKVE